MHFKPFTLKKSQLFRSSLHVSDAQNLALQVLLKKMSKAEVNVLPYKAGYPSEPDRKDESVQANVVRAGKNANPKAEGSHDSPDGSQQPNFTAFKDLSPSSDSSSTKAFRAGRFFFTLIYIRRSKSKRFS